MNRVKAVMQNCFSLPRFLYLGLFGLLWSVAQAGLVTDAVPVTLTFSGNATHPGGTADDVDLVVAGFAPATKFPLRAQVSLVLQPGKIYEASLSWTGAVDDYWVLFPQTPGGYLFEFDGILREELYSDSLQGIPGGSAIIKFRVIPADAGASAGRMAGEASSLSAGKLYWEMSLGALANGDSARALALIGSPSSSDWSKVYTMEGLVSFGSLPEDTPYPGGRHLIFGNEAYVDIRPIDAESYSIEFFGWSVTKWDAISRTFLRKSDNTPATPFVRYVVGRDTSSPSATKLKITRIDYSEDGTTALTRETTLERTGVGPNFHWKMEDWHDVGTPASVVEESDWVVTDAEREETIVLRQGSDDALHFIKRYHSFSWGEELVYLKRGEGTKAIEEKYLFYDSGGATYSPNHLHLQSRQTTGGGWEAYDYSGGVVSPIGLMRKFQPFTDIVTPPGENTDPALWSTSAGVLTEYEYSNQTVALLGLTDLPFRRVTSVKTSVKGTVTSKTTIAYDDGLLKIVGGLQQARRINGVDIVVATRKEYRSDSDDHPLETVTKYYREDAEDDLLRNQVHSIRNPDGTMQAFVYQAGTFHPETGGFFVSPPHISGGSIRFVTIYGTSQSTGNNPCTNHDGYTVAEPNKGDTLYLVPYKSTMQVAIRDFGTLLRRIETCVWNGTGWATVSSTDFTYDYANRLTKREASNGAIYEASYANGRLQLETDEGGAKTAYTYDSVGRIYTATSEGVDATLASLRATFQYDAAGHVLQKTVSSLGAGPSETLVYKHEYNTAGVCTSTTEPGPNGPSKTIIDYDSANRTTTTTLPATSTTEPARTISQTFYPNGALEKVTGTATIPKYYSYDVLPDGTRHTKVQIATNPSNRYSESWIDWLGRTVQTSRPGFTGQPAFVCQYQYNSGTGLLERSACTGMTDTLYEYDALSQLVRSGLKIGTGDSLVADSGDRITDSESYFENVEDAWWLTRRTRTYPFNNGTSFQVAMSRTRLTGLGGLFRAHTKFFDSNQLQSELVTYVDRASKTTGIVTIGAGLAHNSNQDYVLGLPTVGTTHDNLTYTTSYDALRRPYASTAPRVGTSITTYRANSNFTASVFDAAGNTVATYGYDDGGRVRMATNAESQVVRYEYNTRDQIVHQWGPAAHPVEYIYGAFGQLNELRTFRKGTSWSGETWATGEAYDRTVWDFDDPSGLLRKKSDDTNKFVEFDYYPSGQVAHRYWARRIQPSNDRVTTTYTYDDKTAELKSCAYNDGTPGVNYAYKRSGLLDTIEDYTGIRTFGFDATNPLELVGIDLGGFYGNRVLTRNYDAIHRPAGVKLGIVGDLASELSQTHLYNDLGRFEKLTAVAGGASRAFTYGYNSGGLVQDMTDGASFSVLKDYEPHRNLLKSVDALWNGTSRTSYNYTYNALGQRKTARQGGNVFDDFGNSTYHRYDYNARGEVENAVGYLGANVTSTENPLPGRFHTFRYDFAGNREKASRLGTPEAVPYDTFTPNSLNQYATRTNLFAHTAGTVVSLNTGVTVTSSSNALVSSLGRQGPYWDAQVALLGGSPEQPIEHPDEATLDFTATLPSGTPGTPDLQKKDQRKVEFGPVKQTFTYDDDGNLLSDGVWEYRWDAENRLWTMYTGGMAANYVTPRSWVFRYDYAGRRVEKFEYPWITGAGWGSPTTQRRFLYDGAQLIAEYNSGSGSPVLFRTYAWGLDLADSLGGAGGAGGLLQITDHSGESPVTYFATNDSSGNVTSLLRVSDGAVVARYEYSPFGELLRAEGEYARKNPIRFSSQYVDDETGLVYYGARYYSPSLGRFINRDPIGESGGLNLYGFCANDGVNHVDVGGMGILEWLFGGGRSGGSTQRNPDDSRSNTSGGFDPFLSLPGPSYEPTDPDTIGVNYPDDLRGEIPTNSRIRRTDAKDTTRLTVVGGSPYETVGGRYISPYETVDGRYISPLDDVNPGTRTINVTRAGDPDDLGWYHDERTGKDVRLKDLLVQATRVEMFRQQIVLGGDLALDLSLAALPELLPLRSGALIKSAREVSVALEEIAATETRFVLVGEGSLESAGVVRRGEFVNRVFDSRFGSTPGVSAPLGRSFSPGSGVATTATEVVEQRGLMIYNTNNGERAIIYKATENIPTTVRTSLGGTAPELLIEPANFGSLEPVFEFPVVRK